MAPQANPAAGLGADLQELMARLATGGGDSQDVVRRMAEAGAAWTFDAEFDAASFAAVFEALCEVEYSGIESIKVWKCGGGDESVRSVCRYLDMSPPPPVNRLDFTSNRVSALGCELLARTLALGADGAVESLTLDHNSLGTAGVELLSLHLSHGSRLRRLSLRHCSIGEEGGKTLAVILEKAALEVLHLRGNALGNSGVVDVLHSARETKTLTEVDLCDTKIDDAPEVIEALCDAFAKVPSLARYDLSANKIGEEGTARLIAGMEGRAHLDQVLVSDEPSAETSATLLEAGHSAGKGKGKKGKKSRAAAFARLAA